MVYVSYCLVSFNDRLLVVEMLFVFGGFWFSNKFYLFISTQKEYSL